VEGASMTDIISRRCDVWAHKTNLTLPLFIEVLVASQESERSCICVLGIFSWILNCSDSVAFDVFHFFFNTKNNYDNESK
jgi:hypothetical protein